MLNYGTRDTPNLTASNYLNDKMDPSVFKVTGSAIAAGFSTPFVALSELGSYFSHTPLDAQAKNLAVSTEAFNQIASSGHPIASFFGNVLGTILNPLNLIAGEGIGAAVGKGTEALLGGLAPSIASKAITPTLTGSKIASHMTVGAAAGSAFSLAPSISDNYDNSSTKINWAGVAKETFKGGALGLGIGALPFAYGLIRYRLGNNLPVTAAEKAFAEKNLNDHVGKDLEENIATAKNAEDIVNKYIKNDSITVDQGYVNAKLMDETDIGAMQSSIADMLTSKQEVDPKILSNILTPGLRPLLEDDQVMGGLTEAKKHIDMLHSLTSDNLFNTLQKRLPKLAPTFKQVFKLSDEQMDNLLKDPSSEKILKIIDKKRSKSRQIISVLQDENRFGKRTVQQASEIELALDTLDKLAHYNRALKTVDVLNNLKNTAADDETILRNTKDYLNSRVSDSSPLPKIEKEQNNITSTQQEVERNTVMQPNDSVEPENLPREAEAMAEPISNTQKAIDSLKKNNKVLGKLISCLNGAK